MTLADFLADISTFFSSAVTWMTSLMTFITANPALIVLILAMPIVGFAVGLFRRLKNS